MLYTKGDIIYLFSAAAAAYAAHRAKDDAGSVAWRAYGAAVALANFAAEHSVVDSFYLKTAAAGSIYFCMFAKTAAEVLVHAFVLVFALNNDFATLFFHAINENKRKNFSHAIDIEKAAMSRFTMLKNWLHTGSCCPDILKFAFRGADTVKWV